MFYTTINETLKKVNSLCALFGEKAVSQILFAVGHNPTIPVPPQSEATTVTISNITVVVDRDVLTSILEYRPDYGNVKCLGTQMRLQELEEMLNKHFTPL